VAADQLGRRRPPAVAGEVGALDTVRIQRMAEGTQPVPEGLEPFAAGEQAVRTGDDADPPVPQLHEMVGDQPGTVPVVGQDGGHVDAVVADAGDPRAERVEGGHLLAQPVVVPPVAEAARQQQYAARALGAQPGEVVELQCGVAEGVSDEHEEPVLVGDAHRADGERGEVGVRDVVDDQPDDRRGGPGQSLGRTVGRVSERRGRL
jgi:hypothetical protein